jgi:hypothetical protein
MLSKKCSANVYFGGINYEKFKACDQSFVPMMPSTFGGGIDNDKTFHPIFVLTLLLSLT